MAIATLDTEERSDLEAPGDRQSESARDEDASSARDEDASPPVGTSSTSKPDAAPKEDTVAKKGATSTKDTASKAGPASKETTPAKAGAASKKNAASKAGAASKQGAASKKNTASQQGTASKKNTASQQGAASKKNTASQQGAASKPGATSMKDAASKGSSPAKSGGASARSTKARSTKARSTTQDEKPAQADRVAAADRVEAKELVALLAADDAEQSDITEDGGAAERTASELTDDAAAVPEQRWAPRRLAGGIVRMLAMAIPVTASAATGIALAMVLPAPSGALGSALWYGTIFVASMVALFAVDRVARRLLPLSILLRLSLIFPDEAPSRLGVALRAGSKRALTARIAQIRAEGGDPLGPEGVVMLGAALNAHDRRTRGHSERVRALTELVAAELRLPADDADRLRWGAFLHDIGKLNVPAPVLNKSGKLDAREWHVIQQHPLEGERFATSLEDWLGDWLHAIGQHHERFDGSGYPDGLEGDEISLAGRIVAVTDAYETMTAVRSYNRPKSPAEARQELSACAGTHFDPLVVRAFTNISIGRLRWTAGLAAWLAQIPFLGVPMRAGAQMATSAAGAQGSANAVAGSVLMSVAGIATPVAMGSGVAAAAIVASPAASSDAPSGADTPGADTPSGAPGAGAQATIGGLITSHSTGSDLGVGNGGTPPGQSGSAPGQSGTAPGRSGSTPGQSGSTPGQSGSTPPGQSGSTPGQSGSAPGQSGSTPPGQSGSAPGQSGSTPPGQSGSAPSQSGAAPGQSDAGHGQGSGPGGG